jgi:hypothetical protein
MTDLIEIPIVVKDKGLKQSITTVSQLEKRLIAASKAVDAGSMSQDRYNKILLQSKRDYQTLGVSSQKATYEVRRFAQAQKEAAAAARLNQTATQTLSGSKVRYAAAARSSTDATSRLRQSFLSTANSVAILDGPLGGIASRFSAFGVLIGRTGLLLGGFMVTMSALGVFITRGIRSFVEFEVATAKIGAILRATGKDAEFAGAEVERMVSRIAMSTLESEQSVRAAATQLLTFRNRLLASLAGRAALFIEGRGDTRSSRIAELREQLDLLRQAQNVQEDSVGVLERARQATMEFFRSTQTISPVLTVAELKK